MESNLYRKNVVNEINAMNTKKEVFVETTTIIVKETKVIGIIVNTLNVFLKTLL